LEAEFAPSAIHDEESCMNARSRTIRRRFTAAAISGALAATALVIGAGTAGAARPAVLYAAPAGQGKACKPAAPCSIGQAQAAVRSRTAG
jgi:hypothetical protein